MPRANPARKAAKPPASQGAKTTTSSSGISNQRGQQVPSRVKAPANRTGKSAPASSSAGPDDDSTDDDRATPPVTRGSKALERQQPSNLKRPASAAQRSRSGSSFFTRPQSEVEDLSSDDSSDGQAPEDRRPPPAARLGKGTKELPSDPPGDTAPEASRKRSAPDTQSAKAVSSPRKRLRSEIYVSSPDESDGAPAQEDCRPAPAARHGKGTKESPARPSGDSAPRDSALEASLLVSPPPRRSPRKHYIVRFANALDAFPDHQSSMSLYESWSEDRKAKELSKYRKVGQDNADGAEALAERFQRGAQNSAYAFEIMLGRSNASLALARSDGEMLQLAGRFAGARYIPK